MLNVDFFEKKLKNLEEGKYKKNLNGRIYDIEVKNIDDNNKLFEVYENNKLIINFNYYKDGKKNEGEDNMEERKTIDNLIEKLMTLNEGYAQKYDMNIVVSKIVSPGCIHSKEMVINDEEYNCHFAISDDYQYTVDITTNNDIVDISTKKTNNRPDEKLNRYVSFRIDDKLYSIKNNGINVYNPEIYNSEKNYFINNNTLINKIDEKHCIGYDLDIDKVYLYIKKPDSKSENLDIDYFKMIYNKNINKVGDVCNSVISIFKNKIDNSKINKELNGILENITIPKINLNFEEQYEEICKMAELYKKYSNYFSLLDDENFINQLYNFINTVEIKEINQKIYQFKNNINNNELDDLSTLYYLRTQLREIIKLKKRENKPRILSLISKKNVNK